MSPLHPLARPSLARLAHLDPVRREAQQRHGQPMIDAHSSTNPYGGVYARYPGDAREELRAMYARFLMAEAAARGGDGDRAPVTAEHVLLSAGAAAGIELIFRAFLDPARGDRIAITSPAFPLYGHAATSLDLGVIDVPLQGPDLDHLDVDAIAVAGAQVVFLCSPNNPTGRCLPGAQVRRLLERFTGIVVVDEAYVEFAEQASAATLVTEHPNLIVTRTFSKAWGLAGVRAGAVVADPSIIHTLSLIQLPFVVNQAAELALRDKLIDPAPVLASVAVLNGRKRRLVRDLAELAIVERVYPSDANFVLVAVADADAVHARLCRDGILVAQTGWALPSTLRISVGTEADTERVLASLARMPTPPAGTGRNAVCHVE